MPDIKELNNEELNEIGGGKSKRPKYIVFPKGTWIQRSDGKANNEAYYIKDESVGSYHIICYILDDHFPGEYTKIDFGFRLQNNFPCPPYHQISKPDWVTDDPSL